MLRKLALVCLSLLAFDLASLGVVIWAGGSVAQIVRESAADLLLGRLVVRSTNPTVGNDANDRRAVDIACTTDSATSNSNFSDENCMQLTLNANHGQNSYGGGTNAKKTFIPLSVTSNAVAAGQRFVLTKTQNCYGMGDCFLESNTVNYSGADIAGDEGQGFQSVSYLQQQGNLNLAKVAGVPRQSNCNTTLAQSVTGGSGTQSVAVAGTSNCFANDWVIIGQAIATGYPNNEAVRITSITDGHITGIFRNNHNSGATVTPALVLNLSSTYQFGQNRVLVNLSGSSYSTGTVSSIRGGGFSGSGTSWANNMVGGGATNIGCIALTADDYNGPPFEGSGANGMLKSWYQIISASATLLGIFSFSVAGDASYHGKGPGLGAYIVRPCAEIMKIVGNQVILESTSSGWDINDAVELAISPYPDVTALMYQVRAWTTGGAHRGFMNIRNTGARTVGCGICLVGAEMRTGSNADTTAWGMGFAVDNAYTGIDIHNSKTQAINLGNGAVTGETDNAGKILWGNTSMSITPNTPNGGIDFAMVYNGVGTLSSQADATTGLGRLSWNGVLQIAVQPFSALPSCVAGLEGAEVAIRDGSTATFNGVLSGGGSNHVKAYCNGVKWTVH